MPSAESRTRRLKIVACRQVYTGKNQVGHEFTVYEVEATREDGRLINEKLRAFKALPIGQVVEVDIAPFVSERHGTSFTLHPTQSTSPNGSAQLNEALELLREMKTQFAELERRVEELEAWRAQNVAAKPAPGPTTW